MNTQIHKFYIKDINLRVLRLTVTYLNSQFRHIKLRQIRQFDIIIYQLMQLSCIKLYLVFLHLIA